MQLEDIIEASIKDLTSEELETRINILKRLRTAPVRKAKSSTSTESNADKRLKDVIKKLSPEQLQELMKKIEEG